MRHLFNIGPTFLRPCPASMSGTGLKSEQGFSLLEALVALVVFSIAAIALLSVQSEGSRAQLVLEDKLLAEIVGENILVEQGLSGSTVRGTKLSGLQENGGKKWRWTISRTSANEGEFVLVQIDIVDNSSGQLTHTVNTLEGAAQ